MIRPMIPWVQRRTGPLKSLEREVENMMDRFFGTEARWLETEKFVPCVNVSETEKEFEVTVDLPGMKSEEINVDVHEGELWITGEKKEEKEEKGKTFHRIERHYGHFRRVIPLPSTVSEEEISAEFTEGVLKVMLPFTEAAKPKHIKVKS